MIRTISRSYQKQNELLHQSNEKFGACGYKWAGIIHDLIEEFGISCLLDYGCGKSTLFKALRDEFPGLFGKVEYREYDPCVPGKKICFGPSEFIVCTDVLEHIEPEFLDNVLRHIRGIVGRLLFLNINLSESDKVLDDGRNAHLLIRNPTWWVSRIGELFSPDSWVCRILPSDNPKNLTLVYHRPKC